MILEPAFGIKKNKISLKMAQNGHFFGLFATLGPKKSFRQKIQPLQNLNEKIASKVDILQTSISVSASSQVFFGPSSFLGIPLGVRPIPYFIFRPLGPTSGWVLLTSNMTPKMKHPSVRQVAKGRTPRVSHCTCPLLSQRSEGACAPRNRHPVFPERLGESSTLWQKSLTVSSWQPYLSQQRTVVSFILYFRVATLIGIRRPRPKGVGVKSSSVRPFVRIVAGTGCGRHLFITQRFSSQLSTACQHRTDTFPWVF